MSSPRYDGFAFYDEFIDRHRSGLVSLATRTLRRLVGRGAGRCLDVGCGGGRLLPDLIELGWEAIGVDESHDQLRVARDRVPAAEPVQADAASLPFDDASFDLAVSVLTHTDMGDFTAVVRQVRRVVRPGGRFIYVGNHPCFVGPTARHQEGAPPLLVPGYRRSGWWSRDAAGITAGGLRHTLGTFAHWPLGEFLGAFAGFVLDHAEEPDDGGDYPKLIALAFSRP